MGVFLFIYFLRNHTDEENDGKQQVSRNPMTVIAPLRGCQICGEDVITRLVQTAFQHVLLEEGGAPMFGFYLKPFQLF